MDELKRIGVFTKVVQNKSFSGAARQLNVAKSAVSMQIRLLEQEVGVRLLNRSTRTLSLTEAGEVYYRHCQEIVNRAEIAISELRQHQNQPTGTLRVASATSFGAKQLIPVVKEMRNAYPHLNIELLMEDRIVNMVEEGIDLSIRIGWLKDSNLVAKRLCQSPRIIVASNEYLTRYGTPTTPDELVNHQWVNLSLLPASQRLSVKNKDTRAMQSVPLNSHIKSNSINAVVSAVVAGLGITSLTKTEVYEELQDGRLIPILQDYEQEPVGVYAVYAHREHIPPKVRLFMEFLQKRCANAPWALIE